MDYLSRIFRYIQLHFLRNPKYFFYYVLNYFNPNYLLKISYTEIKEVPALLQKGKSIIRFGDGEIYLINGGSLSFQEFDPKLRELLLACITKYDESSPYILGLNRVPLALSNRELAKHNLLTCWLPSKVYYSRYFNHKTSYLDAAVFYDKDTISLFFESYLQSKKLIVVSNTENIERLKTNKNIPLSFYKFIETRVVNAFRDYEKIKKEIIGVANECGKSEALVLLACGPMSKALAFELSGAGIQTIDIGHGIEVAYAEKSHILDESIRMLK